MTTLKQYRKTNNFIIAGVVDEDGKLVTFTVADTNLERSTAEKFDTAYEAYAWAIENHKSLV